jgi:antitoxin HicB
MSLSYKILLKPEPEGGFTVNVPALPGCITYGSDLEEAKANAREAIELYIESLKEHGEVIPSDEGVLEYNLQLFA